MTMVFKRVKGIKSETLTLVLVNLAGIMERADESLLPGVYKEVGAALHTDPTGLGSLTLFRSIVQSACYPLATYLAVRHNRTHVIVLGAFLWAAATFLVGFSSTFVQVATRFLSVLIYVHLGLSPCLMMVLCVFSVFGLWAVVNFFQVNHYIQCKRCLSWGGQNIMSQR